MLRTHIHKQPTNRHTSRPFFSKGRSAIAALVGWVERINILEATNLRRDKKGVSSLVRSATSTKILVQLQKFRQVTVFVKVLYDRA